MSSRMHSTAFLLPRIGFSIINRTSLLQTSARRLEVSSLENNRRFVMTLPTVEEVRNAKFPKTVDQAGTLFHKTASPLSEPHTELLSALMSTSDGARGVFVALLSDQELSLADQKPLDENMISEFVKAGAGSEHARYVREIAVKNVVMPAAMVVQYNAGNETELAASSQLTRDRAIRVVHAWRSAEQSSSAGISLDSVGAEMRDAVAELKGRFAPFIQKWGYDESQRAAMKEALREAFGSSI